MQRKTQTTNNEICDHCALAHWDTKHINQDWQGKPIGLRCPHQQWLIIRGTKACDKFKPQNNG